VISWDSGLEGVHLNIAAYPGTPLRVVAGPGTGKTYALMRRIARLLETGTRPSRILAVSFTRTAANDLVQKLSELGAPGADEVVAKTLHSLCFSILSKNEVFVTIGRKARPLMDHEVECLVSDLSKHFGGKRKTNKLLAAFEADWATLQHMNPGWPVDTIHKQFNIDLLNWLKFHEAILIGELIPLTLGFMRRNPASPLAPDYDFVLADEYQDLNRADQELIDAFSRNGQLTVVGDEDQSIYSFRYAHPEGISKFHDVHPDTHDENLNVCRRCPKIIIEMANSLITRNTRGKTDILLPKADNPAGEVFVIQHRDGVEEVNNLAA